MIETEMPTLMMVSHGNSGDRGDPAADLAGAIAPDWNGLVVHGYMRSEPGFANQLMALSKTGDADRLIIFPLFFSDGYLVSREIPEILLDAGLSDAVVLPATHNLPGFTELASQHVRRTLNRRGWDGADTTVFLVPHGLKTATESQPDMMRFADRLRRQTPSCDIQIANIEGAPSLTDWRSMSSRKNALFVPMLAGGGTHARQDLPEMIARQQGEEIAILPPVGAWNDLPELVRAEAERHVVRFGARAIPLGPTGKDIWQADQAQQSA